MNSLQTMLMIEQNIIQHKHKKKHRKLEKTYVEKHQGAKIFVFLDKTKLGAKLKLELPA